MIFSDMNSSNRSSPLSCSQGSLYVWLEVITSNILKMYFVCIEYIVCICRNLILTLDWNIFLLGLCPFTFLLPKSSVTNIPFWRNIFDDEACLSIFSLSRTLRKVAIIGRTCNYHFFREIELSFYWFFIQCPKSNQTKFFTILKTMKT